MGLVILGSILRSGDVGGGLGGRVPGSWVGFGEKCEAAFDITDGVKILIELELIIAAQMISQAAGIFKDEV